MKEDIMKGAEVISQFCRMNANKKKDLPLRASQIGFLIYIINNTNITPVNAASFFGVTKASITKTIAPYSLTLEELDCCPIVSSLSRHETC